MKNMDKEGSPIFLGKKPEDEPNDVLGHFSLSDLENYKKATEGAIQTAQHIMKGIDEKKDKTTYNYYKRHLLSEREELERINKEIIKRKV